MIASIIARFQAIDDDRQNSAYRWHGSFCFFLIRLNNASISDSVNSARIVKLKEFLEKDPNDNFTKYALGLEYASIKHYEQAIATFEALCQRDPDYVPTYYQLADVYRQVNQKEKALAVYREGIMRARSANDLHAVSELQAAMDELEDEM